MAFVTETGWAVERNWVFADKLAHRTPDEVVEELRTLDVRESIARCVAENSPEDAMTILDVCRDVYDAIVAYVQPRWPDLF